MEQRDYNIDLGNLWKYPNIKALFESIQWMIINAFKNEELENKVAEFIVEIAKLKKGDSLKEAIHTVLHFLWKNVLEWVKNIKNFKEVWFDVFPASRSNFTLN